MTEERMETAEERVKRLELALKEAKAERGKTLQDRFIGLLSAAFVGLMSFWVGSFAKDTDIVVLQGANKANVTRIVEVEKKLEKFATKDEVNQVNKKVDNVLTALCIMDEKTCKLKEVR